MTINAKLQFGNNDIQIYNKEYLIVKCKMHTLRKYDAYFPVESARAERVELTVIATHNLDLKLQEWYISQNMETGRLLFEMTDFDNNESVTRQYTFDDAVCYSLSESYDINDKNRRRITICFVANEIKVDDVSFNQ